MTQVHMTITEAIIMGNWDRSQIAKAFDITEEEVADIQIVHDRMLSDDDVTEEQYQEWCDATDKQNSTSNQLM